MKKHHYKTKIIWTGNRGEGTKNYRAYDRSYEIQIENKPIIKGSSDPAFLGDPTCHNPEEQLVAALSSCHLLWYLHLCSTEGIVVIDYKDEASGIMEENKDGSGQFTEVTLRPEIRIEKEEKIELANSLHKKAHALCFIARSVNFPIHCQPNIKT
jgi:organic hydroperoxide reductase OsmC/OhrA